jgi:hypothetical protein
LQGNEKIVMMRMFSIALDCPSQIIYIFFALSRNYYHDNRILLSLCFIQFGVIRLKKELFYNITLTAYIYIGQSITLLNILFKTFILLMMIKCFFLLRSESLLTQIYFQTL